MVVVDKGRERGCAVAEHAPLQACGGPARSADPDALTQVPMASAIRRSVRVDTCLTAVWVPLDGIPKQFPTASITINAHRLGNIEKKDGHMEGLQVFASSLPHGPNTHGTYSRSVIPGPMIQA